MVPSRWISFRFFIAASAASPPSVTLVRARSREEILSAIALRGARPASLNSFATLSAVNRYYLASAEIGISEAPEALTFSSACFTAGSVAAAVSAAWTERLAARNRQGIRSLFFIKGLGGVQEGACCRDYGVPSVRGAYFKRSSTKVCVSAGNLASFTVSVAEAPSWIHQRKRAVSSGVI